MEQHLRGRDTAFLEFNKSYANELRLEVAEHVRTLVRADDIQIRQVNAGERKEALVEEILAVRGRREGVVCILGAIERCRCFKVGKNQKTGFLQLQLSPGKCQHFYVYLIDAEFGLCHLRIPTWAPFRLQFCCNGHDWLERQMLSAGQRFKKADNCFTQVSDFAAAQALLKNFEPRRLHRMLDEMAARWVAVHGRFGQSLHWSAYQAEWSTDIVFKNDRPVRGVNFFREDDLQFLHALQRGEHQIQGVRNRTLQPHPPGWKPSRIGRALRRFRVLKLIKPVAVTRKNYPTARGESLIIAGLQVSERVILPALAA